MCAKKEPEFGSYAGQLGTGHGVPYSVVHLAKKIVKGTAIIFSDLIGR
jgi:hypothetical protein